MQNDARTYTVARTKRVSCDVVALSLVDTNGQPTPFSIGQVIDVYFPETGSTIGKPYSISNTPGSETLDITVRAIGLFSNRLCALQSGDTVFGSLPYGSFRPHDTGSDLVLLAAGMGITPFHGMLPELIKKKLARRIALLHSVRRHADMFFKTDFQKISSTSPYFSFNYFLTGASETKSGITHRRIETADISTYVQDPTSTEFLICGTFSFLDAMRRMLAMADVPEDRVITSCISSVAGVFEPN